MVDLVDELHKAHEAATPGEWLVSHEIALAEFQVVVALPNQPYPDVVKSIMSTDWGTEEDARFIALAHNSMPTILKALEIADMCLAGLNPDDDAITGKAISASAQLRLIKQYRALKGETP